MIYEMTLETAEGTAVVAWAKADSAEAFRIADAMSAFVNEPLAMLCVCHSGDGDDKWAAAWKVYPRGWVQSVASETALDARRSRFLNTVNDLFEKYGRNI